MPRAQLSMLVFDPNPGLLRLLVRYLEEQHAATLKIAGAAFREADVLALAAATCPQVILLGANGSMQDTLRLIVGLRRLVAPVIVVVMSDLGMAGYAQAALASGADIFVDKDQLNISLIPTILAAARHRGIVPSPVPTASGRR